MEQSQASETLWDASFVPDSPSENIDAVPPCRPPPVNLSPRAEMVIFNRKTLLDTLRREPSSGEADRTVKVEVQTPPFPAEDPSSWICYANTEAQERRADSDRPNIQRDRRWSF